MGRKPGGGANPGGGILFVGAHAHTHTHTHTHARSNKRLLRERCRRRLVGAARKNYEKTPDGKKGANYFFVAATLYTGYKLLLYTLLGFFFF